MNLFENTIDINNITCHSGGAYGSDSFWDEIGQEFGVKTKAYSYKTKTHKSPNKIEISEEDYNEGVEQIKKANLILKRSNIDKFMNLLARNWAQVKYSSQIFAIGHIVLPGEKGVNGYISKSNLQTVDGGTGWAISMSIQNKKDIYVYDQIKLKWFRWSYLSMSFIELEETPKIKTQNFAGIGTRQINSSGIKAIREVYETTFKQ
jgi:hypothetical protein